MATTRRHDLPLFAGTQNTEDIFLHSMYELDKELVNHLKVNHPLWEVLKNRNLIKYQNNVSTDIQIPLLTKPNSTVKSFTGYDDADLTPQDATEYAIFMWGHIAGTQMYNREEMEKNAGDSKLKDLMETKTEQLKTSINNHFATKLIGNQNYDGRDFMGIGRILQKNAVCGGINPTKSGYSFWNPQIALKDESSNTKYPLSEHRAGLRKLRRKCTIANRTPDVFFLGEDVYEIHCDWMESKSQIQYRKDEADMVGGFEMLINNGKYYIYDENLPAKEAWALNFKDRGVQLRIHKNTNFSMQPWEMTPNKIATKHRHCLLYASVVCCERRLNGKIVFS